MIIRIQGEGQWELNESQIAELNKLDDQMTDVLHEHEDNASVFAKTLGQLLGYVRQQGRPLPPEEIHESDLILPPADATIDEVTKSFTEEGLIPG
jgi:hypothetical protein